MRAGRAKPEISVEFAAAGRSPENRGGAPRPAFMDGRVRAYKAARTVEIRAVSTTAAEEPFSSGLGPGYRIWRVSVVVRVRPPPVPVIVMVYVPVLVVLAAVRV